MSEVIKNKVAESGLVTINPEDFLCTEEIVVFDLKDFLFMEMILKEKEFREALKKHDWQQYQNKYVSLVCTADAIIPVWAWMLAAAYLQPMAKEIFMGNAITFKEKIILKNLDAFNVSDFTGKRIVIKGCGDVPVSDFIYMELTKRLLPFAQSIMYGEQCSTVPVYKKPLQAK